MEDGDFVFCKILLLKKTEQFAVNHFVSSVAIYFSSLFNPILFCSISDNTHLKLIFDKYMYFKLNKTIYKSKLKELCKSLKISK